MPAVANRSNEVKEILKDILEPEVHYEHKWLFVIIPVMPAYDSREGYVPNTEALLSAYCKHCDTYYTKTLEWHPERPTSWHAGLPRWGCIGPEGRF
jgi:hypothetical protein